MGDRPKRPLDRVAAIVIDPTKIPKVDQDIVVVYGGQHGEAH